MRYEAVLFDVGGTLVGPRESFGSTYARTLAAFGLEASPAAYERAIQQTLRRISQEIPPGSDRYRHYPGGEQEYWLRFSRDTIERATGRRLDDDEALAFLKRLRGAFEHRDAWHLYEDVPPTLARLHEMGVRMAVVSNWDSKLPGVLELLDLARWFDHVAVSHLERVEKPDPELFHVALRALGVPPDRALHVGDRPELDAAGAKAAGIDVILVDRSGGEPADGMWTGLTGLPELVAG
jgi:putative hydrolase of the HAD superfamily